MPPATAAATIQIPAIYKPYAEPEGYMNREWLAYHYVALLSENRPESRILSPTPLRNLASAPSKFFADESLDWGASIDVAPDRPSGTLTVTLEYAGRGMPSPVMDPWD